MRKIYIQVSHVKPIVMITQVGVQSNLEWIGLCIAINRSILTDYQKNHFFKTVFHVNLPAIKVNIDTATDVPNIFENRTTNPIVNIMKSSL